MDNVLQKLGQYKIIPVVTIQKAEETESVLGALCRGGLPVAEICFRTPHAEEAIRLAVQKFPQMLIGAGTVIGGEQCARALAAGAKFIVSPGLSAEVAKVCLAEGVPYLPGIVTPTEIMQALALGLTDLKFFPAESFGGLKTIRALSAAFPQVRFMPTGGVNLKNVSEYLAFPKIFACGGSWMVQGTAAETETAVQSAVAAANSLRT